MVRPKLDASRFRADIEGFARSPFSVFWPSILAYRILPADTSASMSST